MESARNKRFQAGKKKKRMNEGEKKKSSFFLFLKTRAISVSEKGN